MLETAPKVIHYQILLAMILIAFQSILSYNAYHNGSLFYENRINEGKTKPKVFDIGLRYIPDTRNYPKVHSTLVALIDSTLFILPFCFGVDVLIEFIQLGIIIIVVRALFINITVLPKFVHCDRDCTTVSSFITGHCYDYIFSGHFSLFLLLMLIAHEKGKVKNPIIPSIVYGIAIIAVRSHYTIDIIVGLIITIFIFQNKDNFNLFKCIK